MRVLLLLLLLLFLLQPPDPGLQARWDSPTSATVTWTQTTRACLSVTHATSEHSFIGCWEGAGRVVVTLGRAGSLDALYRPAAGDVYQLVSLGQTSYAPLVARPIYVAVLRA